MFVFCLISLVKLIFSDIDIICIIEIYFFIEYFDVEFVIFNYRIFRNDRDIYGGGLCIYVYMRYNV